MSIVPDEPLELMRNKSGRNLGQPKYWSSGQCLLLF